MCGIVGIASEINCINDVVSGLKSLEYRGYDSSGIAVLENNEFVLNKAVGKISKLSADIKKNKIKGKTIIGHTRWATHGKPILKNCHPFVKDNCALVHNGIIENYEELLKLFSINKNKIQSETDSEIIAQVYDKLLNKYNNPIDAIINLNNKIEGTYSFAFLVKGSNSIYATRKGSPLLLGLSNNFNSISSDVLGLPDNTKEIIRVYHRIIEKLMNLDEYDEDEQRVSLEDICKKYKIKLPTQGRQT